ncbi:MAG: hypothetical protein Q8Q20_05400 [bacterium]|nr:hypothetical protein [bacterium]
MPKKITQAKIQRFYGRILLGFVIIAVLLTIAIVYFSFSKTIITIEAADLDFSTETIVELANPDAEEISETAVPGVILEHTTTVEREFSVNTVEAETPAKARGTVTIYNTYSQTQPLIATTRLLSEDGRLFRTDETVNVPPGGTAQVTVTADQEGPEGEIGPGRFTIPGLWSGLQDQIYAESTAPMTGGTVATKVLTEAELETARDSTFEAAYAEALRAIETELDSINADLQVETSRRQILSQQSSDEVGAQVSSFSVSTTIHILAAAYDENALEQRVLEKVADRLPEHAKLNLDPAEPMTVTIEQANPELRQASLRVVLNGSQAVTLDHPIFDRAQVLNKDRTAIQRYYAQYDEVESVNVQFSPFWVLRSPSLEDHVEIKLAD